MSPSGSAADPPGAGSPVGKRLAHYDVLEKVGEGGMGEVYRARDTRLGRDVAIKLVPPRLLGDAEHLARFEREARVLASLSHPHIAAIHGLEEHEGRHFLVLEFIAGADLAQRLQRGPMAVEDVLPVARQMAEALEVAHRQGVIHRDLKPGNVAFTSDGAVKVLDFGLAKALDDVGPGAADLTHSPTRLAGTTAPHVILGTAAYMSPEQARGNPVDARADVWAFGCVVYECLTGRRAFAGDSVSETLAAVLRDTADLSRLPAGTPPALRRLLRRCLERDPARRLHSLADARLDLDDAAEELARGPEASAAAPVSRRPAAVRAWLPWGAAVVLAGALVLQTVGDRSPAPTARVSKFAMSVDSLDTAQLCPPAISPDGRSIVYSAGDRLWVRDLDDLTARELPGTEGARLAFWSPDAGQIGYQASHRLWRVPVEGGRPIPICETGDDFSSAGRACWGDDGRIVYSTGDSGIYAVAVSGGVPGLILEPDPRRDDDFHAPSLLPHGRGILFVPHPVAGARNRLEILDGSGRRTLWEHPGDVTIEWPVYSEGHVLFFRDQPAPGIWALPFSLDELAVTGEPFLVADGGAFVSVSDDGTLIYPGSGSQGHALVRVGRDGTIRGEPLDRGRHIDDASLSPSGGRLIEAFLDGSRYTVTVRDLTRGTHAALASGTGVLNPFWISDEVLGLARSDSTWLVAHDLGAGGPPRVLFRGAGLGVFQRATGPPTLTADGRHVLFELHATESRSDVWMTPADGSGDARALVATPAREWDPQACPAGPLFAYVSDQSGRAEVYLSRWDQSGDGPLRRWQVSSDGGEFARWSRDGRHLYYESEDRLLEVDVGIGNEVSLGRPRVLFDLRPQNLELAHGYSVTPDDTSFLMIQAGDPADTRREIVVVQNWVEEFRAR